ncbi:MAG: hypothetical protein GWM90_32570, partial [Gemmatimonadetes bacterium]|nr:penicillin acylase family protein [Gemmatimonadota bacterium]NIQ60019.1 penicillin acylase family protein [Gemmatimonadota bacterium]NIU80240.1 hypothetical protein [Gammaproteobacteria bacterium]NIX48623.1 hypothetical protein [Gemmatimonadota bacterium]
MKARRRGAKGAEGRTQAGRPAFAVHAERGGAGHPVVVAVVLFTLLAVVTVVVLWVRSAEPDRSGTWETPGLGAEVTVLWDSLAVPHVWAGSTADLLFAQGFLHARDRLFQMDLVRRTAQGRLAEVLGQDALDSDRFLRTMDLWSVTAEEERRLAPELRALLEA